MWCNDKSVLIHRLFADGSCVFDLSSPSTFILLHMLLDPVTIWYFVLASSSTVSPYGVTISFSRTVWKCSHFRFCATFFSSSLYAVFSPSPTKNHSVVSAFRIGRTRTATTSDAFTSILYRSIISVTVSKRLSSLRSPLYCKFRLLRILLLIFLILTFPQLCFVWIVVNFLFFSSKLSIQVFHRSKKPLCCVLYLHSFTSISFVHFTVINPTHLLFPHFLSFSSLVGIATSSSSSLCWQLIFHLWPVFDFDPPSIMHTSISIIISFCRYIFPPDIYLNTPPITDTTRSTR